MATPHHQILLLTQKLEESDQQYSMLKHEYLQLLSTHQCTNCSQNCPDNLLYLNEQVAQLHILIDQKQAHFAQILEQKNKQLARFEARSKTTDHTLHSLRQRLKESLRKQAYLADRLALLQDRVEELTGMNQKLQKQKESFEMLLEIKEQSSRRGKRLGQVRSQKELVYEDSTARKSNGNSVLDLMF